MANIKNELNNIKSALYGKDVRSSIYNGIDAINNEVESTTDRQVDLENTFDQLIINAGNSNAEIVDARVKNDGTSYSKLGDRLDAVDSQLGHIVHVNLESYSNYVTDLNGDNEDWTPAIEEIKKNINKPHILLPNRKIQFKTPFSIVEGMKLYGIDKEKTKVIVDLKSNSEYFIDFKGVGVGLENITFTIKKNANIVPNTLLRIKTQNLGVKYLPLNWCKFENINFINSFENVSSVPHKLCDFINITVENGINGSDDICSYLCYFHMDNIIIDGCNTALKVNVNQYGVLSSPTVWMTECYFRNWRVTRCLRGVYFKSNNTSDKPLFEFDDIHFIEFSVQGTEKGSQSSAWQETIMFESDFGECKYRPTFTFTNCSFWDLVSVGRLVNTNAEIVGRFTYTESTPNEPNKLFGFSLEGGSYVTSAYAPNGMLFKNVNSNNFYRLRTENTGIVLHKKPDLEVYNWNQGFKVDINVDENTSLYGGNTQLSHVCKQGIETSKINLGHHSEFSIDINDYETYGWTNVLKYKQKNSRSSSAWNEKIWYGANSMLNMMFPVFNSEKNIPAGETATVVYTFSEPFRGAPLANVTFTGYGSGKIIISDINTTLTTLTVKYSNVGTGPHTITSHAHVIGYK